MQGRFQYGKAYPGACKRRWPFRRRSFSRVDASSSRTQRSCGAPRRAILRAILSSRIAGTACSTRRLDSLPTPKALAARLAGIPGVVEHGLFIGLVAAAIIAGPEGVRIVQANRV